MTEEEIKNCKDYINVKSIINYWNKEDESFGVQFDDKDPTEIRVYYWMVGTVRWRVKNRPAWNKLWIS